MQDNATAHTSIISTEWLLGHPSEFKRLRWAPNYPDINIIEHIWDSLQYDIQKRSPPRTRTDLWTALQDAWGQFPPALLQTLVEFMPRRVSTLLYAHGGPKRY